MPKTEYEYIEFIVVEEKPKTKIWACQNRTSGIRLGSVGWYGPWRQYVFGADLNAMVAYSASCLRDIADFLEQVNKEHKAKKRKE